eukprot:2541059-Pyramimonas_sp.AAC.1
MKIFYIHLKLSSLFAPRFGVLHRQKGTQKSAAARLRGRCSDMFVSAKIIKERLGPSRDKPHARGRKGRTEWTSQRWQDD